MKRFTVWLAKKYQLSGCRETIRKASLLLDATAGAHTLIYIDEAHIYLDTDESYGGSLLGERFWVSSSSPGLAKVSFFGAYIYNRGEVKVYPCERGNSETTIDVLDKITAILN